MERTSFTPRPRRRGLVAPFGPSCFDKSAAVARMNLDVRLDGEGALNYFDGLDAWLRNASRSGPRFDAVMADSGGA